MCMYLYVGVFVLCLRVRMSVLLVDIYITSHIKYKLFEFKLFAQFFIRRQQSICQVVVLYAHFVSFFRIVCTVYDDYFTLHIEHANLVASWVAKWQRW